MLSEELIKQIFFQSDRPRPGALLADDVDIVQFARNVEAVVKARYVAALLRINPSVSQELEKLED
jgi:hypothetical protein